MFFFISFSIFLVFYAYVLFRLAGLVGIKRRILFWCLLPIFAFSFPSMILLESNASNQITRILFYISGYVFGFVLIAFPLLLIFDIFKILSLNYYWPRKRKKKFKTFEKIVVFGVVSVLSVIAIINARLISTREIEIQGPRNFSIVHLSDIHLGTNRPEHLNKIIDMTAAMKPDLVVMTGDLVDSNRGIDWLEANGGKFSEIKAPILSIIGNHDSHRIKGILTKQGVKVLDNETCTIGDFQFTGISDSHRGVDPSTKILPLDKNKFQVLLNHRPTAIEKIAEKGFKLYLAGHTHDGQIFPYNYLVKLRYTYINGLYDFGPMKIHVSPGCGTSCVLMRFGSRNTITRINMVK